MLYRRLADALTILHLLVCIFFLFGGPFCIAYPQLVYVHLPLAVWVSCAFLFGWTCPLTPPEKWLRKKAGQECYEGGFVSAYILKPLSRMFGAVEPKETPPPKGRRNEIWLGVFFACLTLFIHGANWPKYQRLIWSSEMKPPVINSSIPDASRSYIEAPSPSEPRK